MPFTTDTGLRGDTAVVTARGEIDVATAEEFSAVLMAAARRAAQVVVDLSPLDFCDSSGVRVLVRAAREGGAPLQVVCPPGNARVRRVLDVVGLDALVPVLDAPPATGPVT